MNVLLCRHGETPWNREGRYQGHTDIPLAESGEGQARALGKRLADVKIDRAVASPLIRARKTAELILGASRASMLSFDAGLKEISHGGWEGKLVSEIATSHPELLDAWKYKPTATLPAGPNAESLQVVLDRAWTAFAAATKGLGVNDTVLVVAHDAVNRVLLCKVLGLPLERVWSFRQAPATLNVLSGDTFDTLQVVRLNDADHVAPLFQEAVHKAV
ncbi:MAG: histidine phosphatase family protein [Myxococcales bacterium]|nr:histidine phosphatase family protein [Myxococcales bacterium]